MSTQMPQPVENYSFMSISGEIRLADLFTSHDYLVVLHNMGKSCPSCALWGDEFNAMAHHMSKIADFCVIGPDAPQTQKEYAAGRQWRINILSARESAFTKDLGFKNEHGYLPGVSVFRKQKDRIELIDQVNVPRDGRIPSVLEVFMMVPDTQLSQIAWSSEAANPATA